MTDHLSLTAHTIERLAAERDRLTAERDVALAEVERMEEALQVSCDGNEWGAEALRLRTLERDAALAEVERLREAIEGYKRIGRSGPFSKRRGLGRQANHLFHLLNVAGAENAALRAQVAAVRALCDGWDSTDDPQAVLDRIVLALDTTEGTDGPA